MTSLDILGHLLLILRDRYSALGSTDGQYQNAKNRYNAENGPKKYRALDHWVISDLRSKNELEHVFVALSLASPMSSLSLQTVS